MKRIILGALVAVTVTFTSAAADVVVFDNDQELTIDCAQDKNVSIVGNDAKVTLTGVCAAVLVSGNGASITGSVKSVAVAGNDNVLTLDAVDRIAVSGNANVLGWKRALSKKRPVVMNSGNGNKIGKTK